MVSGEQPRTGNFGPNWPLSFENADFQSIFTRSVSAVTLIENVQLSMEVHYALSDEPEMNSVGLFCC